MKSNTLRSLLALSLLAGLSGCGSEYEISEAELGRLMYNVKEGLKVEGEPYTGTVVYRKGETVLLRMEFEDGYPNGVREEFHENGERKARLSLYWDAEEQKAEFDGTGEAWNEDGQLIRRIVADEGVEELKESWCDNGNDLGREEFEDGKRRLEKAWDCETEKLVTENHFNAEGKAHGEHKTWASDGTLLSHKRYENGELHGLSETWHAGGQKHERGEYRAGKPVGQHDTWNEAGDLVAGGLYTDEGEKTGLWRSVSYDGSVSVEHYGPEGFIKPAILQPYVKALGDSLRNDPDTVAFYLDEGQVQAGDAIPADYNGRPEAGGFRFPVRRWTHAVIVAGDEVLPVLLARGADINQADSEGVTRLMRCGERFNRDLQYRNNHNCRPEHLTELLAKGAKAAPVDRKGRNALHYLVSGTEDRDRTWNRSIATAQQARAEALAALVAAGADPNAADAEGMTPLVEALKSRRADLAEALIKAGAKADAAGPGGTRPVHWLFLSSTDRYDIKPGFVEAALPLLAQAGADVDAPFDWDGEQVTLRDLAMRHGLVDLVKQLDAHRKG